MIGSFHSKFRWLSNFYTCDIIYEGFHYLSVEAAYQAAKTIVDMERLPFECMSPYEAKRAGKRVTLRADWHNIKLKVMTELCTQKFNQEPFKSKLISTFPDTLVEGNTWGDTYWGVCKGIGENHLGKIIMLIRADLLTAAAIPTKEEIDTASHWDNFAAFPVEDWKDEVANDATRLSYKDWAIHQIEDK